MDRFKSLGAEQSYRFNFAAGAAIFVTFWFVLGLMLGLIAHAG